MKTTITTSGAHVDAITVERSSIPHDKLLDLLGERLKLGIVHFAYQKADGGTRHAYGTLDPAFIPPAPAAAEPGKEKKARPDNPNVKTYFDLGAKDWRAFTVKNLLAIY